MAQIPYHLFPQIRRPKSILEIGVGRFGRGGPLWAPTIERMRLDSDQSYLGIDIGAASSSSGYTEQDIAELEAAMHAHWESIQAARPGERISFEQQDAQNLPYPDETFDRVIACNVYSGGASPDALIDIYRQSDRVLTQDGELVIYDDLTPYFRTHDAWVEWFADNGFVLAKEPRRVIPTLGTYARYGLPIYDREETSMHNDVLRDRFEQSTLWILGKSAFTQTVEPPAVQ